MDKKYVGIITGALLKSDVCFNWVTVQRVPASPHEVRPQDFRLESAPVAVHYYSRYELRVA